MNLNSDDINLYLNENIDRIYKKIIRIAEKNIGKEENFRIDIAILINDIFRDLEIENRINPEQEYSVTQGRIDSLYGNIIIEYKAPGKISSNNISINETFIEQVQRQIIGLSKRNKVDIEKILGVVFDGYNIIYVRHRNNICSVSKVIKVNKESIQLFLKRLLSLSIEKKALTIENLLNDFSSDSERTRKIVSLLYKKSSNNKDYNRPKLLFEQWKHLFREVCGYDFDTLDLKIQDLKQHYNISEDNVKIDYLIFSIQTYFSLIIKFLSIEVLTYLSDKKDDGLNVLITDNQSKLKEQLEDIESGGIYKRLGVTNFLEGDFFGWYLSLWDDDIYFEFRDLIEEFRKYDYSSINLEPDTAKDLLKDVYHSLFPKELRHNLGEYYTPDWLAEFLIQEMDIEYYSSKSILDPTCGSGTFIVLLIKNYVSYNKGKIEDKKILNSIINNIKGYDLNPLAVISARANYVIALGDLFNERVCEIEIPIYLCDSMLTILEQKQLDRDCHTVFTKAKEFPIPVSLIDKGIMNKILDILNEAVNLDYTEDNFIQRIKNENIINEEGLNKEKAILKELYSITYNLEKEGLNGIWGNIIKNAFAPIFQKKVDYIIGNPPWIVWQSLPEEYRRSIQKYWHEYRVFEHAGLDARLGSAHDDISVLMTYVIMDNFLKDKGKLGFVINQNIFQSSGGGQGFRKLMIRDSIPVKIERVHDFVKVEPFKDLGASNKTAVFTAIKNEETEFPVDYIVWDKKVNGTVDSSESLENILTKIIGYKSLKAKPIKEKNSSWIIGTEEELTIYDKMVTCQDVHYKARKGVDTSANCIYWVKVKKGLPNNQVLVDNSPEASRKPIKQVENTPLEEDLVYPLLRGKDVQRWNAETHYNIVLPYTNDGKVIEAEELKVKYPRAYEYFYKKENGFIDILINRAIYKKHYLSLNTKKIAPEYVLYNIGPYTFSPYKVVWKALASGMIATTISTNNNKLIIPDHNVIMIPLYDEDEAYYISGILNAEIVSKFINAYISWFFSTHILENMYIPKFNPNNKIHKKIVELSREAHDFAIQKDRKLHNTEKQVNEIVESLLFNE